MFLFQVTVDYTARPSPKQKITIRFPVRFENIPNAQEILTQTLQGLYDVDKNELDLSNLRANTKLM